MSFAAKNHGAEIPFTGTGALAGALAGADPGFWPDGEPESEAEGASVPIAG